MENEKVPPPEAYVQKPIDNHGFPKLVNHVMETRRPAAW